MIKVGRKARAHLCFVGKMKISELVCYCITSEIFPVQCVPLLHYGLPVMLSAIKREREIL